MDVLPCNNIIDWLMPDISPYFGYVSVSNTSEDVVGRREVNENKMREKNQKVNNIEKGNRKRRMRLESSLTSSLGPI